MLQYQPGNYHQAAFDLARFLRLADAPAGQTRQVQEFVERIEEERLRLN